MKMSRILAYAFEDFFYERFKKKDLKTNSLRNRFNIVFQNLEDRRP